MKILIITILPISSPFIFTPRRTEPRSAFPISSRFLDTCWQRLLTGLSPRGPSLGRACVYPNEYIRKADGWLHRHERCSASRVDSRFNPKPDYLYDLMEAGRRVEPCVFPLRHRASSIHRYFIRGGTLLDLG